MDSWYEIKSGMTEQHKQYLLELKRVYNSSKKALQESEIKCKKVVEELQEKIKKSDIELKDINKKIESKKEDTLKLSEEIEKSNALLKTIKDKASAIEKGITRREKEISEKEKSIQVKEKKSLETIEFKKKELLAIQKLTDTSILAQQNILASIRTEKTKNEKLIQECKDKEDNLSILNEKYLNNVKEYETKKTELETKEKEIKQREDNAAESEKAIEKKSLALNKRAFELNEINKKQMEEKLDIDYQYMELGKQKNYFNKKMALDRK